MHRGMIPEEWVVSFIILIYKQKGTDKDPSNYKGITLLSCVGNLSTSILNGKLMAFLEERTF